MTDWLLVVEVRGRTIRLAQELREVDDYVYLPGLDGLTLSEGVEEDVAVSALSPELRAVAEWLDEGTATVSRWDDEVGAVVYTSGWITDSTIGGPEEPVTITITRRIRSLALGSQVPAPIRQVDTATWPVTALHEIGTVGTCYPVILGAPGYTGSDPPEPVVPVPLGQYSAAAASTSYAVVCEDPEFTIGQVRLRVQDDDVDATRSTARFADLLGGYQIVAGFGTALSSSSVTILAGYSPSAGWGCGPRSLYDALVYLCRRWAPSSVDWARLPAIKPVLEPYLVDAWIDTPVSDPWAVLDPILATLPVSVRVSASGRYLVERRYTSDPARQVGAVDVDAADAIRSAAYVRDGAPLNEYSAVYQQHPESGWLRQVYVAGDLTAARPGTVALPTRYTTDTRCTLSRARFGARSAIRREVWWTWDEGTVLRVIDAEIARAALPAWLVTYELRSTQLREGDEVLLTDPDAPGGGWVDRPAIVDAPPLVGDTTSVLFRVP